MIKILVATRNLKKINELSEFLDKNLFSLSNLDELNIDFTVEETGNTFEENATLKAEQYGGQSSLLTIADDSGLEVSLLNGAPGVFSARYGGEGKTDKDRNDFLIQNLQPFKDQEIFAKFVCVIAIWVPQLLMIKTFKGEIEGKIHFKPRGSNGFGYDPLFYIPSKNKTFAEMSLSEKQRISHRGQAMAKAVEFLYQLSKSNYDEKNESGRPIQ